MTLRLAVDIGGTFTDLVLLDQPSGDVREAKALTTPHDLTVGVIAGLTSLGVDCGALDAFIHGTTVGLNALIEGRVARTALVTTKGFRDVYAIGRTNRPEMYDLFYRKAKPLVPRRDIFEIDERVDAGGRVLREVRDSELRPIVKEIQKRGIESVAICTLNAYVNRESEERIAALFAQLAPNLQLSVSHVIANEWREYERMSTTVANAALAPVVSRYLERLEREVQRLGYQRPLFVMQSSGGVMTAEAARRRPISTLLSGPSGGATGAAELARQLGFQHAVAVDLGGTSFDVTPILNGRLEVTTDGTVRGHPVLTPMVRIAYTGAGGGSIARASTDGVLRVGPESAGAVPGPACYGRGGIEATLTDANLVLGRLGAAPFAAHGIELDREAAAVAIRVQVAEPLGMDLGAAARGVVRVAVSKMALAVREVTVEEGLDPGDFALFAFGGAGPMHAAEIAAEIGIPVVVVPPAPGTFCAWGMLNADFRHDLVSTVAATDGAVDIHALDLIFHELEETGTNALLEEGLERLSISCLRWLDLRYRGQEHTLRLQVDDGHSGDVLKAAFGVAHEQKFGYRLPEPVEVVNVRVTAVGGVYRPHLARRTRVASAAGRTETGSRHVTFGGQALRTSVYERDALDVEDILEGPAVIEEDSATTVLPPGWILKVERLGVLVLTPR